MIPSELDITGNISFDAGDSAAFIGSGSQTATMERIISGTSTTSSVADLTVTGANPLGGLFTDFDDGVGLEADVIGNEDAAADGFIFDFVFSILNTYLTDSFEVFFEMSKNFTCFLESPQIS